MISLSIILDLFAWIRRSNQSQLLQSCQSLLFADLVHNFPILQRENSCTREIDLFSGIWLVELANCEVVKFPAGVLATPNPAAYHVVSLSNQGELVGVEGNTRERLLTIKILGLIKSVF